MMTATEIAGSSSDVSSPRRLRPAQRFTHFVKSERLVLGFLAVMFLARHWLSGRNSFWLDELLSVNIYGQWHDSAREAVSFLAENSIHPPLYQFTLYHWLGWFGDSEVAARSLSNLYIAFAGLFLYLALRIAFSRQISFASVVTFSVMHTPVYYAMESRSYAQTMMLVTLSSYLLLLMMSRVESLGWRATVLSPAALGFTLANAAFLLTHYYNMFFWVAQALMAAVFVLRQRHARQWAASVAVLAGMYVLQAGVFALVWGSVFLDQFVRRSGDYELEGAAQTPLELFRTSVLQLNIDSPRWAKVAGVLLLLALLTQGAIAIWQGRQDSSARRQAWVSWYLIGWMLLPLVMVWAVFSGVGVARYSSRYFVYCVVPLAPIVVLAADQAFRFLRALVQRTGRQLETSWSLALVSLVVFAFVLPGGNEAAAAGRHDWRGIAEGVNNAAMADPESSFIVYETAHRARPMLNHYFDQLPGDLEAFSTLARFEERNGEYRLLDNDREFVEEHDFLVITFTHSRTRHFPNALELLESRYDVRHRQLDHMGRGFIVFATDG